MTVEPTFRVYIDRPGRYFLYHGILPFVVVFGIVLLIGFGIAMAQSQEDLFIPQLFGALLTFSVFWHVCSLIYRIVLNVPLLEISTDGVTGFSYFIRATYRWDDIERVYMVDGKGDKPLDLMRIVRKNKSPLHWVFWGITFGRHEEYILVPLKFASGSAEDILAAFQRYDPAEQTQQQMFGAVSRA